VTTVWIAQRSGAVTECHGVFSTREKAIAACTSEYDWIAPRELDVRAPEGPCDWTGVEWPRLVGPPIDWDAPAADVPPTEREAL